MNQLTRNRPEQRAIRQRAGVSMIEMLISLTLAMVMLASLVMLYLGAAQTSAREMNLSSANSAGRLINSRLAREFRLAGLMAPQDVNGDSNDITRDVPNQAWSDSFRSDFEYASTYEVAFVGDMDNDGRTDTEHILLSGDTLVQETWTWSRTLKRWEGPVRRHLGTQVSRVIFDYFDKDDVRIPDTVGYRSGGFVLNDGQRRQIVGIQMTLCLHSATRENRIPDVVVLPDGTQYNDTFRRAIFQFMIRSRNLSLGT